MSLLRRPLNFWLRAVEKRRMRRGDIADLRRALALQSRFLFHGPKIAGKSWSDYGGVPCLILEPHGSDPNRVLLYIHGGGFVFGSPDTHSALAANLAQRLGAQAILPRYRRAPEHRFPAAPDDVRSVWDALLAGGVAPQDIVLGGDSAGGALALGLVAALCQEGADMPGAVFAFSPLTDLTFSGESFVRNADADVILAAERGAEMARLYLGEQSGADPATSPLYASFKGGPPVWITVGDTEILLDDGRRMAARLLEDGVNATLVVEHDLPHVWPIFHNILPKARHTLTNLACWIRQQQHWEV